VDPIQIQQVFVNLVRNAAQAMEPLPGDRRRLTIRSTLSTDVITVCVDDSGPGFAGGAPASFRALSSTKSDGMGLGLSISQSIVVAHGGDLSCENLSPHGARVRIALPIVQATRHFAAADSLCCG
jgi:signal transduction histidine kinase